MNDTELDRELQDIVNRNADEARKQRRKRNWTTSVSLLFSAATIAAIGSIAMAYGEAKVGFCMLAMAFILCGVDDRMRRR